MSRTGWDRSNSFRVFFFEPDHFYDAALDYALVAVAATSDRGVALADYGWLTLNAAQGKIVVSDQDYLNIIQHPLGREKEVVIRNNRVLELRTSNDAAADSLALSFIMKATPRRDRWAVLK